MAHRKADKPANEATELIREITDRFRTADSAEDDNRRAQIEDLKFIYATDNNAQWQDSVLDKRKNRPNYTFNRTIGAVNQVIGDQRQNKPSIKVRGVDSGADPDTAETFTGLIRNIEDQSDAETAYDTAFKFAVGGGFGVWRVMPEFMADDSFDQEIRIVRMANPHTAYVDPGATDFLKRDANWWIITERIDGETFEDEYPGKDKTNIELDSDDNSFWFTEDEVRIAEYWRKVPKQKELALLSNGAVVELTKDVKAISDEMEAAGITIERTRMVRGHVIEWVKVSGADILEGPITYNWKYIPIVPVYGRSINIEGEELIEGVIRHAKDAQRVYNYEMSTAVEVTAIQPRAPYMATAKMIKGYEEMYRTANLSNSPYMLYNIDQESPLAMPSRSPPPDVPIAILTLAQQAASDIDATTGFKRTSGLEQTMLANQPSSGRALIEQRRTAEAGDFEFFDNLAKAIKFTGEILVDMIPQIYDTERQIRILGQDGKDEIVTVNQTVVDQQTKKKVKVNDLRQGRYDVAVSVGPSYQTQRQEAADILIQLSQGSPIIAQTAIDLVVKNLDLPGADELEKRLRGILIKQGVIKATEEDKEHIDQPSPEQQEMQKIARDLGLEKEFVEIMEKKAKAAKDMAAAEETKTDTQIKQVHFAEGSDVDKQVRVS